MKLARIILGAVLGLCAMLALASLVAPVATATVLAHATPSISPFASWLATHALGLGGGAATGAKLAMWGPLLNLKALRYEQLVQQSGPIAAGQPECYPGFWFDTQTFTSAAANTIGFFAAINSDKTISNMNLAGQFPSNEFFKLAEIHVDLLIRPLVETAPAATNPVTGQADDEIQIRLTSKANVTFTYRNKPYGPYPIGLARPIGAARVAIGFTGAATTAAAYALWDAVGLLFEKQIIIAPTSSFAITVANSVAVTLIANASMRVGMRGPHYRTVN